MKDVDDVLEVNLNGLLYMSRMYHPSNQEYSNVADGILQHHMMERKPHAKGTIVNISSITGPSLFLFWMTQRKYCICLQISGHQAPTPSANEASYHTSKAAVEAFSNVLRHETCGTNIRILVNRPGVVNTEFHARRHNYNTEAVASGYQGLVPLVAEDIAAGVLFQCLQPERVSVVTLEMWASSQRSLYVADRDWEQRNAK